MVRGRERISDVDAQRGRARRLARQARAADLDLGEWRERIAHGRLGEIVGGEEPEQERTERLRSTAAGAMLAVLERRRGVHVGFRDHASMVAHPGVVGGAPPARVDLWRHAVSVPGLGGFRA